MSMAFQAGLLNVGGFMACHRFVSHVTGFATFFGHELSQGQTHEALGMLAVPIFFLVGVMVSGFLVDLRIKLNKKPQYYVAFAMVFLLLLFVFIAGTNGFFGKFGDPNLERHSYTLLAILCLVCGIQNGTITSVSKAVVRTTHLTGMTTDLGIGLVRFLNRHKIPNYSDEENYAILMRIGIIVFFALGSVVGAIAFDKFAFSGFLLPLITSGLLLCVRLYIRFFIINKRGLST